MSHVQLPTLPFWSYEKPNDGLRSFLCSCSVEELANKRIGMFSYGSGVASSFFSARFVPSSSLTKIVDSFKDLFCRLDRRIKVNPEEYDKILQHKEDQYNSGTR